MSLRERLNALTGAYRLSPALQVSIVSGVTVNVGHTRVKEFREKHECRLRLDV
jgi:hypothetical protein